MAQLETLTMASRPCSMSGSGTVSQRMSCLPCQTSAFMNDLHVVIGPPASGLNGSCRFPFKNTDRFYRSRSRSEEHTSELQSLMRISYAVFCLKKKKNKTKCNNTINCV